MSDLADSLKKLKYDNRMVKWNKRQKLLTDEEYKKYVSGLKDLSNSVYVEPEQPEEVEETSDQ